MTGLPVALVSYEDLDRSAYSRARLANALADAGMAPVFLGRPRKPTLGELAKVAFARGDWAPETGDSRADGIVRIDPLDLPLRRFAALERWDRRSMSHALERFGERGWVIVFPTGTGKPWPKPRGWKLCWYATDEFAAGNEHFARREAPLLAACDLLVGVSETVVAPRRDAVKRAAVLPNGYDGHLFPRLGERPEPDHEMASLPRPRIGYVGAVNGTKVDVGLLVRLAVARPSYTFVLAGPIPDPALVGPLRGLGNVRLLEPRPYIQAPRLVAGLDICLIPYKDTPVNRACSPLKVREALALGVPVVSTPVDELMAHPGAVFTGRTDEEILTALDRLVAGEIRPDPEQTRWFTEPTWGKRAEQLAGLLTEDA